MDAEKRTLIDKLKDPVAGLLGLNYNKNLGGETPSGHSYEDEAALSRALLNDYKNPHDQWAQRFKEAQEFKSGAQWTKKQRNDLKARGHSPMTDNRMLPIIETAKAMLTYNRPQFRSTGREDSDTRMGKLFSDLFQWVFQISTGNIHIKRAVDDYYVGGMGVLCAYQDPHADMGKGEVFIESINPLDVYVDPNSKDVFCDDAAHILVARMLTMEQAKRQYPTFWTKIKEAGSVDDDNYPSTTLSREEDQIFLGDYKDMYHKRKQFIHRYTLIKVAFFHVYDSYSNSELLLDEEEYANYRKKAAIKITKMNSADSSYVTDDNGIVEIMDVIRVFGRIIHKRVGAPVKDEAGNVLAGTPTIVSGTEMDDPEAVPGSTVYFEIITRGELVDQGLLRVNRVLQNRAKLVVTVGDTFLFKRILPCEHYPLVFLMNYHDRNPYPESDVRIFRPMQEFINKMHSLIVAHATTSTSTKVLVPRGSVNKKDFEREWGKAGTTVLEFDAEFGVAPVVAGPVPFPNQLYVTIENAKYSLEYGFGIHDIMMGSTKNAPSTFRGTVSIDEYGQRRSKSKRDDLEAALNRLAKITIPLMQQIYTEEKIIRLIQPNGLVTSTTINQPIYDQFTKEEIGRVNDVTTGMYDLILVSGSTLPSNRYALHDLYIQYFEKGIIDQLEVLKKSEIFDVEGVYGRTSYIKQLEQALEQLKASNKKLEGDLQTAEREEIHAKKRLEVEKWKSDLSQVKNKTELASVLYQERLGDALADIKTQVKPIKQE